MSRAEDGRFGQAHGHKAAPWQKESWRVESTCEVCDRPVVKSRASGAKPERWQHQAQR